MLGYLITTSFSIGFSLIFHIRKIFFQSFLTEADDKIKNLCYALFERLPFLNFTKIVKNKYTQDQLSAFYTSFFYISLFQLLFISMASVLLIFFNAKRKSSKLIWLTSYKFLLNYTYFHIFIGFYLSLLSPPVSISLKYINISSSYILLALIVALGSLLIEVNQSALSSKIYTYENRSGASRLFIFYRIVLILSFFVLEANFLIMFLWTCIFLWSYLLISVNQRRVADSKDYAITELIETLEKRQGR